MSKILGLFKIFQKLLGGGGNWIFGVLMLISLFTNKKKKTEEKTTETTYNSPTYSWDSISNTSDVDMPLPIVFGTHKVGGNIINTHIETKLSSNIESVKLDLAPIYGNNKVSAFLDCGGVSSLVAIIGSRNYYPQDIDIKVKVELFLHGTTTLVESCFHTFTFMRKYAAFGGSNAESTTVTENYKNLNSAYTGGYDLVVTTLPTVKVVNGKTYEEGVMYSGIIIPLYYYKEQQHTYYGSAGETSTQTLYMDIGLSVGQIKDVKYITVNDQPINGYTSIDKKGQEQLRITHDFKAGHDLVREANVNDLITGQSSVFSQNRTISRVFAVNITQPLAVVVGLNIITVTNNQIVNSSNKVTIGNIGEVTVTRLIDNDKFEFTSPIAVSLVAGGWVYQTVFTAQSVPIDLTFPNSSRYKYDSTLGNGIFYDFEYTTKFDYVDSIDLGIVCPQGLYISTDTGGVAENRIDYAIYVAHEENWDSLSPNIEDVAFFKSVYTIVGSKRSKIWYNLLLGSEILTPSGSTGKKKYRIKIKKLSFDPIDDKYQSEMSISYVEEIKNKDLCYNGLAYSTVKLPADPKLNGGNPTFTFTIDGIRVPRLLPASIAIDADTSTVDKIELKGVTPNYTYNDGTTKNITLHTLASIDVVRSTDAHVYLDDDLVDIQSSDYNLPSYPYGKILTCFFNVNNIWHKRYCMYLNKNAGANDITTHKGTFIILTPANLQAIYAGTLSNTYNIYNQREKFINAELLLNLSRDTAFIELNTNLSEVPSDVVFYSWTNNPANALLYLLTDTDNGLKIPLENMDLDSFREAEAYFDEFVQDPLNSGKLMRRCQLNFVIDTVSDIRNHIDKICATCHSSLFESSGKIKIVLDKLTTSALSLNEAEHLKPSSLKVVGLPSKELPNQINITYLNQATSYNKEIITIEDASVVKMFGRNLLKKLDMDLYGVTGASQVYNEGLLLLKSAKYINYTIVFTTALAAFPLEIGDVFDLTSDTHGFSAKLFRVMNIKYDEKQECEIQAIEYFTEIYTVSEEDLVNYPLVYHSQLPSPNKKPSVVKNVVIYEDNEQSNSGDIVTSIKVKFDTPDKLQFTALNSIGTLAEAHSQGVSSIRLYNKESIKKFNLGDRFDLNRTITKENIATLTALINDANVRPVTPDVEAAQDAVTNFYNEIAPYTVTSLDYVTGMVSFTPVLDASYPIDSTVSVLGYDTAEKYEFSKFSHVIADLIKVSSVSEDDNVVLFKDVEFKGNEIKFPNVELGTYFVVINSVSKNNIVGDAISTDRVTVVGKTIKPTSVLNLSVTVQPTAKCNYKIDWDAVPDKDLRTYMVQIALASDVPTMLSVADATAYMLANPGKLVLKMIKDPTEYVHTFIASGNYNIFVATINTSGIIANEAKATQLVTLEITDDFNIPSYTIHGNVIQLSWNSFVMTGAELPRYEVYMKTTPYVLNPVTGKYDIVLSEKAWEGTSTQIPIANLPNTGKVLSFDTPYFIVVVAKYRYNGVEVTKHAPRLDIPSLAEEDAKIYFYASTPEIIDGMILGDDFKVFISAIPENKVETIYARVYKLGTIPTNNMYVRLVKNIGTGLWESTNVMFQNLTDGDYIFEAVSDEAFNRLSVPFRVDTSIPLPLPKPFITKDNGYVKTLQVALNAQTSTPLGTSESIDLFNMKTIQICLPPFPLCSNFSHIKMYISEYDEVTKFTNYTEYKLPQPTGLTSPVVNFKANITFADDMPDFKIKLVMVKKNGVEGSLIQAVASNRTKIDTTPPLIKINSIKYVGDSENVVNNNYINKRVDNGGLLFDLSITETNSGIWAGVNDISKMQIPFYYQINNLSKMPLYNQAGNQFKNPFFIPNNQFSSFADGSKVTITLFALDNAMKVGIATFTKVIDKTPPANVTNAKAIFGMEANKGVIKISCTKPADADFAGIRIYEGTNLIKETKGEMVSLQTASGTTRNFVIKSFDNALNEASGVAVSAINYPPAKVTGLQGVSDVGAVSMKWDAVTIDTNNEIMTDLKYYEVNFTTAYRNIVQYAEGNSYKIELTPTEVTYYNANQSQYINVKVRAIDYFEAVGAYSDIVQVRPKFIEAVDMTGNIFKFVPTVTNYLSLSGTLEHIVDANYKDGEHITIGAVQGTRIKLDMKPEYVAETKIKFHSPSNTTVKFLLHYRLQDPTTLAETDLYLGSASNDLAVLTEYSSIDYSKYLQFTLTATNADNSNVAIISMMKSNAISKKSYYCKYVEVIFTETSTVYVSEVQPRIRSIANDFYGETLMLSDMVQIRSAEDTNNYAIFNSKKLEFISYGATKAKFGELATGVYGSWMSGGVYIGGSAYDTASLRLTASGNDGLIEIGYKALNTYNMQIDGTSIKIGYTGGNYNTNITGSSIGLGYTPYGTYKTYISANSITMKNSANTYDFFKVGTIKVYTNDIESTWTKQLTLSMTSTDDLDIPITNYRLFAYANDVEYTAYFMNTYNSGQYAIFGACKYGTAAIRGTVMNGGTCASGVHGYLGASGQQGVLGEGGSYGMGVKGTSVNTYGVYGYTTGSGHAVMGLSVSGIGVAGQSTNYFGGYFYSSYNHGIYAYSAASAGANVYGAWLYSYYNEGCWGESNQGIGVHGTSVSSSGVKGNSDTGYGVHGYSANTYGGYFRSGSGWALYAGSSIGGAFYCDGIASFNNAVIISDTGLGSGTGTPLVYSAGYLKLQSSSRRHKEAIISLTSKRFTVDDMRPVSFIYKETQQTSLGLIAEEMETYLPELVEKDKEGRPNAIRYTEIIPILIKEIKELKETVKNLLTLQSK